MKENIKHLFSRMKRRKANIHKPEKEKSGIRKDTSKRTAFAVWSLIGGLLFVSTLAVMLSVNTRSTFNDLRAAVNDDDDQQEEEGDMDIITADTFLRDFVDAYMNVSNDPDALEQRRQELDHYMASRETEEEWDIYDVEMEGERRLENADLFHVDETDGEAVFAYAVTYVNEREEEIEPEDDDDDPQIEVTNEEKTLLLNIPVVEQDGQYAVTREPYFTAVDDLAGSITVENEDRQMDAYVGDEQEAILAFVNEFFEEYASGEEDDLTYMMQDPESLDGTFNYEGTVNETIEQQEDEFLVNTEVQMTEDVTGLNYTFEVDLYIGESNGNYIVETMDYQ
ncbi:hypothetical protein HNR44_001743 [Geomicrobium halophilum]|uniref:Conjugative transposon protein TcpC n=1 Tax=Geomicrobium halophilum TaxID=549000 RepID=A0A841PZC7_9BACL|nr:conjugal transfer protein [Geomicrobium halophilum]MBB6449765.1 hypothetical protein [Geomicrobium halophilum]